MVLRVLGDSNFDGFFECHFIDDENIHKLYFNLEDWSCSQMHGIYGKDFFATLRPKELNLKFDTERTIDVEEAREIYEILYMNGWKTK